MEATFRDLVTETNSIKERNEVIEVNRREVAKKLEERTGKQQSVMVGLPKGICISTQLIIFFSPEGAGRRASSIPIEIYKRTSTLHQATRQIQSRSCSETSSAPRRGVGFHGKDVLTLLVDVRRC